MKKSDLVSALAAHMNTTKADAGRALDALKAIAALEIANGRSFKIPGVIALSVQTRAARIARNPATGEPITVPEKRVVKPRVPSALTSMAA